MALSGAGAGGLKTDLTGLSPEEISRITAANIAGGRSQQDSINSIFENAQRMAQADYISSRPELAQAALEQKNALANLTADIKVRDLERKIEKDKADIEKDKENLKRLTEQGKESLELRTRIASGELESQRLKNDLERAKADIARQAEARKEKESESKVESSAAKDLEHVSNVISGKVKDSKGNVTVPTQAQIDRFNQLSKSEYAFKATVPGKLLGSYSPNEEIVRIPKEELNTLYKFFISEGGSGSMDQFLKSPYFNQAYLATRPKK